MQGQAAAPVAVLLGAGGQETPLRRQLLGQRPGVIGLKPTAASDVTDAGVVRFPGVFLHVPSGQDPRLQTCWTSHEGINVLHRRN